MECVPARLEHSGIKITTSVKHVLKTTSVESSPLSAQSVRYIKYLSLNLLSALHVLKDTLGRTTPALNARMTTLETELFVVFVQKDHNHSATKTFAAVTKGMAGNGRPAKMGPARHVQLTFTKTENKVRAHNVLWKQLPYLSLKIASVGTECLGMERAV